VVELAGSTVTALTEAEWERALAGVTAPLPFGTACWRRWGDTSAPGRRFTPVRVCRSDAGELLVPLFVSELDGQLGGFGYGMVCPGTTWPHPALPRFDRLARTLCAAAGLAGLRTLLPPLSTVDDLDRLAGHWRGVPGRPTYVLDLTAGAESVWARARGSARTAVRRAESHRVWIDDPRPADGAAVTDLYLRTLQRAGHRLGSRPDLAFLAEKRADVLTVVARGGDGAAQAVSAFAVCAGTAFHVVQATSDAGRRTNAGHLAFFAAISGLAAAGVRRVDLGSATNPGQERFKLNWGATARPTRLLSWPGGQP
jgi:hypothetical protein